MTAALQAATDGRPGELAELLEDITDRDLHLVGVLGSRKQACANLPWSVVPADDRRRSQRVAAFCEMRLKQIDNLDDALLDLLDAIYQGFAVGELYWAQAPDGFRIERIAWRPQRWFRPDEDDPETWRLLDPSEPTYGKPLVPYRFIVHHGHAKTGFPVQSGLGRPILWYYLFKRYALVDWVAYAELFGMPPRVGKHQVGAKPEDVDELERALTELGVSATAVIPEDMNIEFIKTNQGSSSGPEVYAKLIEFCDKALSKGVLGQTLTTEAGAQGGSRALGQVHDEVRMDLKRADARRLAATLRRDVLTPLVRIHFGAEEAVPTLVFDSRPPEDEKARADTQKARASVFSEAIKLGVPVALAQVQAELGIRPVAAGEETLVANADKGDGKRLPMADRGGALLALAARESLPPHLAQLERAVARYRDERGTAAWAALVEAMREQLVGGGTLEDALERFVRVAGELELGPLAEALGDATFTADLLGRLHVAGDDEPVAGLPAVAPERAAAWWAERRVVTPSQFRALAAEHRARAFSIAGFTSLSALTEAHDALGRVLSQGGTLADWEDDLETILRARGLSPLSPRVLLTVFDTNIGDAYAVGRDRRMREPERLKARPYFRYNTVGDDRVRATHEAMDGRLWPADSSVWDLWTPCNGFNCRCYLTAHTVEEVRSQGWMVESEAPIQISTGQRLMPDQGFARHPGRQPPPLDWDRFPASWVAAVQNPRAGEEP